jgi:hypothetical protein
MVITEQTAARVLISHWLREIMQRHDRKRS